MRPHCRNSRHSAAGGRAQADNSAAISGRSLRARRISELAVAADRRPSSYAARHGPPRHGVRRCRVRRQPGRGRPEPADFARVRPASPERACCRRRGFSLPSSAVLASRRWRRACRAASAKGGEYGIFEGRLISLAHPTVMAPMYGAPAFARHRFPVAAAARDRRAGDGARGGRRGRGDRGARGGGDRPRRPPRARRRAGGEDRRAVGDARAGGRQPPRQALPGGLVLLGLGTSFAIVGPVNTPMRANKPRARTSTPAPASSSRGRWRRRSCR